MREIKVCSNCKYWTTSDSIIHRYGESSGVCLRGATSIVLGDRRGCMFYSEFMRECKEKEAIHEHTRTEC